MLRTTIIGVVACALAVTLAVVALGATGLVGTPWLFGGWAAFQLAILLVAMLFERRRYKPLEGAAPPGFEATPERFVDPATGTPVQVWFNPATGERCYVALSPAV